MPHDAYSFIVRIWRESPAGTKDQAVWRGSIDDVASGRRSYVRNLHDIGCILQEHVGLITQVALEPPEAEVKQGTT
jgi:hypothetical protein